jgi:hypothetical protein
MQTSNKVAIGLGVIALAVPAAAVAKPDGEHGNGTTKTAQYNVKGTYVGDGVVAVEKANGHARKAGWQGTDVAFDFSAAEIRTDDHNGDDVEDLADVAPGAPVKVKARLAKRDPGVAPYAAQRLVDKTDDAAESEDD